MVMDVDNTVRKYGLCTCMGTKFKHQMQLGLFPPAGISEPVAIDILGPLPSTSTVRQFGIIITDRYRKLKRAIRTARFTTTPVAHICFHYWATPDGI